MSREISDRKRRWLTGELAKWQAGGLISTQQAQQILACYATAADIEQRKRRLASFVLAAMAALLVALAVLLVVGHNWQLVVAGWDSASTVAKLSTMFLILAGSYGGAGLPAHADALAQRVGSGILLRLPDARGGTLVGDRSLSDPHPLARRTLVVGHGDAVGRPVFGHRPGPLPGGRAAGNLGRRAVLGCPHAAGFWGVMPNGAYALLPLAVAGLVWCYRKPNAHGVALYAALLTWWIVLQAFNWGIYYWGWELAGVYFVAVTGPLMLIAGENHRLGNPAARPWQVFGALLTAGSLVPLSFYDFHTRTIFSPFGPYPRLPLHGFGGVLALAALAAVALAMVALVRPWTAEEIRRGPLARLQDLACRQWVPLGACLGAVAMGLCDAAGASGTAWATTSFANLAMLTLAIWLMHVGLRDERGLVFTAGVVYFLVWSLTRYVGLFQQGGLLGAAGMFFLCGLALFGLSILWRRRSSSAVPNDSFHSRGPAESQSRPMSKAAAEWVRAPTLIRSTPLSARRRTLPRSTPPEASSSTAGLTALRRATAWRSSAGPMLSNSTRSGAAAKASSSCPSVSTSTSTIMAAAAGRLLLEEAAGPLDGLGGRRAAGLRRALQQNARWLSLMSTASNRPLRWFQPPPQRTAYFSRRRQPGVVLRVS